MIDLDSAKRINIFEINNYLFQFKTKKEFENEFDFRSGKLLGKGTFGIVNKCFSKLY